MQCPKCDWYNIENDLRCEINGRGNCVNQIVQQNQCGLRIERQQRNKFMDPDKKSDDKYSSAGMGGRVETGACANGGGKHEIHPAMTLTIVRTVDARGNSDLSGNGYDTTELESEYNGIWNGCRTDENAGHSCYDERSRPERHTRNGTALEKTDAASNKIKGNAS